MEVIKFNQKEKKKAWAAQTLCNLYLISPSTQQQILNLLIHSSFVDNLSPDVNAELDQLSTSGHILSFVENEYFKMFIHCQ
jgi:hypothetical protein